MESIKEVVSEGENVDISTRAWNDSALDVAKQKGAAALKKAGEAGEEAKEKIAKAGSAALKKAGEAKEEAKGALSKALTAVKGKTGEAGEAIKEHPYIAGGTAAALAAGLGALALRKRIAAAMKKAPAKGRAKK